MSAADMQPDAAVFASLRLFQPEGAGVQWMGVAGEVCGFEMEVGGCPKSLKSSTFHFKAALADIVLILDASRNKTIELSPFFP